MTAEVVPALTIRCLNNGNAQFALSGLRAAVHVSVDRNESGENSLVLGVVVGLVAVDALTLYSTL